MLHKLLKPSLLVVSVISFIACAPKKAEQSNTDEAVSVMSSNLKAVENEYLPESLVDDGNPNLESNSSSPKMAYKHQKDICAGLNFMECQPRLIRAYLVFGRKAVSLTQKIITDVSKHLAGAADNSTGVYNDESQNMSIEFNKRSAMDFDFLIRKNGQSVGRVTANPQVYQIQFNIGLLEQGQADSRGGKLDIQVKFTDGTHWESQITATNQICNEQKPDDPENGRIVVKRNGSLWTGQSMFYNGIAGAYNVTKSCSLAASDNTGLVIYTDFVSDRNAAKASLYVLKRTETSTAHIDNFGLNNFCENYPDLCQSLATSIGATTATTDAYLNQLTNSYCVQRGSPVVTWNSSCQNLSGAVASEPFLTNSNWLSPYNFYKLDVKIPDHL